MSASRAEVRNAALEEAAQLCEADAQHFNKIRDPGMANHDRAKARAIRLLKAEGVEAGLPAATKSRSSSSSISPSPSEGMEATLKPCPFCGADLDHVAGISLASVWRHPYGERECVIDGLEFSDAAIEDWNRRRPDTDSRIAAARREALEEAAKKIDAMAALYRAYTERAARQGDVAKEALMQGHAITTEDAARCIRALLTKKKGETP